MKRVKASLFDIWFDSMNYIGMVLLLVATLYPFYYVFIYSISSPEEAARGIFLLPKGFTFDNYIAILLLKSINQAFLISFLRTVIGATATVLCCSFFSYLITQEKLFLRKYIYRFIIITMYINAGLIPWYLTMKTYGLKNSFLLYVLPSAISAFNVILVKTYIEHMPKSLEESAKIDGAGYFRIFISVILPLAKPIVATIGVFATVNQWNSWTDNYFLVSKANLQTIQLLLYDYLQEASQMATMSSEQITRAGMNFKPSPESIKVTITMITTIPVMLFYPLLQRHFVKGIMMGSIKG